MTQDELRNCFTAWANLPSATRWHGWEFVPYPAEGEPQAVAALRGTEIHFAVHPDWRRRLLARDRIREFLFPLMDKRGYLTTRRLTSHSDDFITRLGFAHTWDEGEIAHYMLTRLPFDKEH